MRSGGTMSNIDHSSRKAKLTADVDFSRMEALIEANSRILEVIAKKDPDINISVPELKQPEVHVHVPKEELPEPKVFVNVPETKFTVPQPNVEVNNKLDVSPYYFIGTAILLDVALRFWQIFGASIAEWINYTY
jgi:hypothetical protein